MNNFLKLHGGNTRFFCTKVFKKPVIKRNIVPLKVVPSKIDLSKLPAKTKIDVDTIALLERLSLVDCANKQGIETLEEAIAFADQILQVETTGVDPLITPLEDKYVILFTINHATHT